MGAWGEKAFENDSALDWVAELETGGVAELRSTLSRVATTDVDDYVDSDDGSSAIAAAEVVASALGLREVASKAVPEWLNAHRRELSDEDRALARRAVERVLAGQSELRDLWEEQGADSAWHADVHALLERLGGTPAPATDASHSKPERGGGPSFDQQKQALLTFLAARGVPLTAQQIARINASLDAQEVRTWLARATTVTSADELFEPLAAG